LTLYALSHNIDISESSAFRFLNLEYMGGNILYHHASNAVFLLPVASVIWAYNFCRDSSTPIFRATVTVKLILRTFYNYH